MRKANRAKAMDPIDATGNFFVSTAGAQAGRYKITSHTSFAHMVEIHITQKIPFAEDTAYRINYEDFELPKTKDGEEMHPGTYIRGNVSIYLRQLLGQ